MAASLFSQPPVAYFQPLESPPNSCTPSFISCACETPGCQAFGSSTLTEFETISSKICGWAGELGKDHDLRQGADHCAWLFSEQAAPFHLGPELPSSALIPTAQRQPRVDFLSSAEAMKNIFRTTCDADSEVGVMVHRLGDWLVIDDDAEISANLAALAGAGGPVEERSRRMEQRQCAAAARAEAAQARAAEAQRQLDAAKAALWQAEIEARKAQDTLREALAEVRRLAEDCERLRSPRGAECAGSVGGIRATTSNGARIQSLDVEVDAPEELQLYRNFLGHSIRRFQDELPLDTSSSAPVNGSHNALVALDGPPAAFRQVGVWKIAGDASVVIGSRMLCLGNAEHPKLTLYLHNASVLSDTVLLEHWVECLIAGVPEFAVCLHRDGAVQSYTLYKVSELRHFLEERLEIGRKLQMTLEVLRWIKRQCWSEGCTYWLSKTKSEPTLKLFRLSGPSAQRSLDKALQPTCALPSLGQEFVLLKNTFLHVDAEDEMDEADALRRSQSCPARFCGDPTEVGEDSDLCVDLCWSWNRGRVSALFFRRAVSSAPGPDAKRFLQHALDLEASITLDGGAAVRGLHMLSLRACCHLGLAVCELTPTCSGVHRNGNDERSLGLLEALRRDSPWHDRRKYELTPLRGRCVKRAQLLFLGRATWQTRSRLQASTPGVQEPPRQQALSRVAHAFSVLTSESAGFIGKHERVEAVAAPIAVLALLHLATGLVTGEMLDRKTRLRLICRTLRIARSFAVLDAAQQRPEAQPLFAQLPSSEELLVRVEHLSACAVHALAHPGFGSREACSDEVWSPLVTSWAAQIERDLEKMEQWLEHMPPAQLSRAFDVLSMRLGTSISSSSSSMLPCPATEGCGESRDCQARVANSAAAPRLRQCLEVAEHYERSIRLLPKAMQRGSPLLRHMMIGLSTALVDVAASMVGSAEAAPLVVELETLIEAEQKLQRAESLADAAGHEALAALLQAGRGHLQVLAADLLVSAGQAEGRVDADGSLSAEEASALQRLYDSRSNGEQDAVEEEDTIPKAIPRTIGQQIGRLADSGMGLVQEAQHSVDNAVDPEVASVLLLMNSGLLQATASQFLAVPPTGTQEADLRRTAVSMLTGALQGLLQFGHAAGPLNLAESAYGASLAAHAHLMQAELYMDCRGPGIADKPHQRLQRADGHLARARAALHGAASGSWVNTSLLVHLHLAQQRLLGAQGCGSTGRRQAFEELVAACQAIATTETGSRWRSEEQDEVPDEEASSQETRELLLQRLRSSLRDMCAREATAAASTVNRSSPTNQAAASTESRWKVMYRMVLQLTPDALAKVPTLYASIVADI